ncbi:hypothetical protein FGIG_06339 [Fasciola gigantica]|uniref:Uncharacterized protein n=1 Tax=Fasciola gigantica TaxID=46835 RepID=A0A504YQQ5_FASGI|nr:hypothetical protein FGIG_06339 [Fasciola gigantica]
MLVRTVCRSSSSSTRSAGGRAGVRRNDRDRGSQNSTRGRDARSCRSRSSTNDLSDPLQMTTPIFNDSELPPAYKDVVSGLPGVLFVGPGSYVEVDHGEEPASPTNRFGHRLCKSRSGRFRGHGIRRDQSNRNSTNNDSNNIVDNTPEQVASSSQMVGPRRSSTPPPPSYEDVMSLPVLQSGADECAHVVDVAETSITTVSSSIVTDVQPHAEEIANDASVDNHHRGLMDTNAGRCSGNNPAGSATIQHPGSSSPQTSDNVPPSAAHSDHVYLPHSITEATVNPPGQLAG